MQTILILSDLHAPYHDEASFRLFLKVAAALEPIDYLVVIGDLLDCYAVSTYVKTPARQASLKEEVEEGAKCMDSLNKIKARRKIFCFGNHEARLERYINQNAAALSGMISIDQILGLSANNWQVVPYGEYLTIGKISVTHDVGRSGVNAGRQSLNDFGNNLVIGHTHRGGTVYGGTYSGDTHVCLDVGWLGSKKYIDYAHKAKVNRDWQHGFGLVHLTNHGRAHAQFIPIIRGECVVNGKLFR